MKTARFCAVVLFVALFCLCAPQRANAQSTASVYGSVGQWYDAQSQVFHGNGLTVMQDFSSYLNHYVPYVDVQLDGPTGSADAYYANWWGGAEAYASTTLDADEPGTYTVTATHGADITYYDVWEMAQTMWGSFFEHWLMSSPGFYSEEMNIPGPVDEFETYNQLVVVAPVIDGFLIIVTDGPESNAFVSGQAGHISVQAIDQFGHQFPQYRGTVHFTSPDATASLPSDYTYASGDNGVHAFEVTLKTVADTMPTRQFTVQDSSTGAHTTQASYLWFQVTASREGKVGGTTQCGHVIQSNDHFVALSVADHCGQGVIVRYGSNSESTSKLDRGPSLNDPYWNTSGVPQSTFGIDLADGTFYGIGLTDNDTVLWRFN
jgi:hypothetical protein